jgi:hypothetical protein
MNAKTESGLMLAHMVYFTLKDRSPQAVEAQVTACHKYLSGHPGQEHFSVGTHVADLTREVNQDFDVALNVVFASRKAHDDYQSAEKHLQFIAECRPGWAQVRVYDSYLS